MTEPLMRFTGSEARQLLRRARTGTLASLNREGGHPYASLVNVGTDVAGEPLILISSLAWHTRNLAADARASLMVAEPPATGDALTGPRITVMGRFEKIDAARARRRYLARHRQAAVYVDFSDFAFWRMVPEIIHAVAGFGRIETLGADDVFPAASEMVEIEDSAIARINHDHAEALRLLGGTAGHWQVAAIDTDGADLICETRISRLGFDEPVATAHALRQCFAALSAKARQGTGN